MPCLVSSGDGAVALSVVTLLYLLTYLFFPPICRRFVVVFTRFVTRFDTRVDTQFEKWWNNLEIPQPESPPTFQQATLMLFTCPKFAALKLLVLRIWKLHLLLFEIVEPLHAFVREN